MLTDHNARQRIATMRRNISDMRSEIDKIKRDRATKRNLLEDNYNELKAEMTDFVKHRIFELEHLERQSIDELNEIKKTVSRQIEEESQTCDRIIKVAESVERAVQESNEYESTLFIVWCENKKIIEDNRNTLLKLEKADSREQLSLKFHSEIEICLRSLKGLGKLNDKNYGNVNQVNVPYLVQKKVKFSLRDTNDNSPCQISGMCQLPNGNFVLSDRASQCLKVIDSSYHLVSQCTVPSGPNSICCTGDTEVAVALDNNKILFVSVGNTMEPVRCIKLKQKGADLAYSNEKLYITSFASSVYIYSLAGICESEINFNDYLTSRDSIAYGRSIAVSPDGNNMYVTNPNRNLLLINDIVDRVISTFSPRDFRCSTVCVDDVGNVFVCGCQSESIVQVEARGCRKVANIVSPSDGIHRPRTMVFDRKNSRLLVACFDSDEVHALDLVQ